LNEDILYLLGITHIVNCTIHVPNKFESIGIKIVKKGVKYLNIRIDDTEDYSISKYFKTVYQFIDSTLKEVDEDYLSIIFEKVTLDESKSLNENFQQISSWTYKNKLLQIIFKNIYSGYNNKNRILIHCSMGVSRSSSLAIMFVMKRFKLCLEEVNLAYIGF
jgi:hypothetical protein